MKNFINNMRYINELWRDLTYYAWAGTHSKANHVATLIDKFEVEHPICGWIARYQDLFTTLFFIGMFLLWMFWFCSLLGW